MIQLINFQHLKKIMFCKEFCETFCYNLFLVFVLKTINSKNKYKSISVVT